MPKGKLSLTEFAMSKRRRDCKVCQLPSDVRDQLVGNEAKDIRSASDRGIKRPVQIEWLKEIGYDISSRDLTRHYSGRHEQAP